VPEVLSAFAAEPKAWFKFVARGEPDLAEIAAFAARFAIPAGKVLVMPEGRTAAELDRHALALVAGCIARGWRLCDRLHVRLWGDRRGV
jgi:organic radical activating enzyme